MEPSDDDLTLEMDDAEVARLASLRVPELDDDVLVIDDVVIMCTTCLGVVGMTCSCPTEVR